MREPGQPGTRVGTSGSRAGAALVWLQMARQGLLSILGQTPCARVAELSLTHMQQFPGPRRAS